MANASLKVVTPNGALKYCTITGQGRPKLKAKGKFVYQASVIVTKDQAKEFKKIVDEFFQENKPSGYKKDTPANKIIRDIEGDKKNKLITFSTNTVFEVDGEEQKTKIKIKNSKNQERELPEGVSIGDGSKGAISGKLAIYGDSDDAGVSMFLNAVQITKFVEYKSDDGFEAVDDDDGFDDFEGTSAHDFPTEEDEPKKEKKKKKGKKKKD
jgi:hypothetical protein